MSDDKSKKKNILKGIFPKKKRSILRKSTSKKVSTILENLKLLRTIILWMMRYSCNLVFLQVTQDILEDGRVHTPSSNASISALISVQDTTHENKAKGILTNSKIDGRQDDDSIGTRNDLDIKGVRIQNELRKSNVITNRTIHIFR